MLSRSEATIDHKYAQSNGEKYSYVYALTITAYKKNMHVDYTDLGLVMTELKKKLPILIERIRFETSGKYKQLHCHCTVYSKEAIHFKENAKFDKFRAYWAKIYNETGWHNYCEKDQQINDNIRELLTVNFD